MLLDLGPLGLDLALLRTQPAGPLLQHGDFTLQRRLARLQLVLGLFQPAHALLQLGALPFQFVTALHDVAVRQADAAFEVLLALADACDALLQLLMIAGTELQEGLMPAAGAIGLLNEFALRLLQRNLPLQQALFEFLQPRRAGGEIDRLRIEFVAALAQPLLRIKPFTRRSRPGSALQQPVLPFQLVFALAHFQLRATSSSMRALISPISGLMASPLSTVAARTATSSMLGLCSRSVCSG